MRTSTPLLINKIQEINLQLIRIASFNSFDGEKIANDLVKNKKLWREVVMDRASYNRIGSGYGGAIDLIKLRDIEDNIWNVDTLFILPTKGSEKELEKLAKSDKWGADNINWTEGDKANDFLGQGGAFKDKILSVWWD